MAKKNTAEPTSQPSRVGLVFKGIMEPSSSLAGGIFRLRWIKWPATAAPQKAVKQNTAISKAPSPSLLPFPGGTGSTATSMKARIINVTAVHKLRHAREPTTLLIRLVVKSSFLASI